MKTKLIGAALARLVSGSAIAMELEFDPADIPHLAVMAARACNFRGIPEAMLAERKELFEQGMAGSSVDANSYHVLAFVKAANQDRPAFCKAVWDLLGPAGSYRRQLLEMPGATIPDWLKPYQK